MAAATALENLVDGPRPHEAEREHSPAVKLGKHPIRPSSGPRKKKLGNKQQQQQQHHRQQQQRENKPGKKKKKKKKKKSTRKNSVRPSKSCGEALGRRHWPAGPCQGYSLHENGSAHVQKESKVER